VTPALYLGLDSSSPHLALALWSDEVLASFCEEVGRDHAQRVTSELDALFARAGVRPQDLAGITVGTGPGSYTGLRVGIAVAKGLARGLGVPLRGEPSLAVMAAGKLSAAQLKGVFALDARRGNVYAGVYRWTPEGVALEGEIIKAAKDTLLERHANLPYFENLPPDAAYLARRAALGGNEVRPLYL
jgi:tRNA threonylcarbamoyladenosine biosynthesis protein TsaB